MRGDSPEYVRTTAGQAIMTAASASTHVSLISSCRGTASRACARCYRYRARRSSTGVDVWFFGEPGKRAGLFGKPQDTGGRRGHTRAEIQNI